MNKKVDQETLNKLVERKAMFDTSNPIEVEYISMVIFDYLFKVNQNNNLSDDFEFSISEDDLNAIVKNTKASEKRYKQYQFRMLLISLAIIILVFMIQLFVVKASLLFSFLVSLSLGLADLYYLNRSLFPKYLKSEEKKIINNVSMKTRQLASKLQQ